MQMLRTIALGIAALGVLTASSAQISGPTPLAWRWQGNTPRAPIGSPLVDGDNVYVGVGSRVFCIDRVTGNRKWQYPTVDPIDGVFTSNLVLHNGTLYAAGSDRNVYALNPATGESKWTYLAPGAVVGKMAVAGKLLMLNIDASGIMAIDSEDGKPLYTNPERVFDQIRGDIFAMGTTLYYMSGRQQLFQMNVSTRRSDRIAGFQAIPSSFTPVVSGNNIYIVSGNFVSAVSSGGTARWNRMLDANLAYGPAVSGDSVAAVSQEGRVFILDNNGSLKTRRDGNRTVPMVVDLGSTPIASPSVTGNMISVVTANGALNLVDPVAGKLVWSYTIRPGINGLRRDVVRGGVTRNEEIVAVPAAGSPVLAGKTLLVLSSDGSLLAFDPENGVDLSGPEVKLIWPQAGLQLGTARSAVEMYFNLLDETTGIDDKSLTVTVNGNPVESNYGRDGILTLRVGANTKNGVQPDGRMVVEITVKDWMGNETKTSYSFTVDNTLPPIALPGGRPGTGAGGGDSGPRGGGLGGGMGGGG
jgi:outer membrane protein assembly factor BamB